MGKAQKLKWAWWKPAGRCAKEQARISVSDILSIFLDFLQYIQVNKVAEPQGGHNDFQSQHR
jgi:hypothetical protein